MQLIVCKNCNSTSYFSVFNLFLLNQTKNLNTKTADNTNTCWTSTDCESGLPLTDRIYFCVFDKKDKNANFPH